MVSVTYAATPRSGVGRLPRGSVRDLPRPAETLPRLHAEVGHCETPGTTQSQGAVRACTSRVHRRPASHRERSTPGLHAAVFPAAVAEPPPAHSSVKDTNISFPSR